MREGKGFVFWSPPYLSHYGHWRDTGIIMNGGDWKNTNWKNTEKVEGKDSSITHSLSTKNL